MPCLRAALLLLAAMCCAPSFAMQFQCTKQGGQALILVADIRETSEGIVGEDVERLRTMLARCKGGAGGTVIVDLNSGGGSMVAGIEMGKMLLAHNVHTRVSPGNRCVSACTFVFLGGRYRQVMPGGTFEPHGFSSWRFGEKELLAATYVTRVLLIAPEWLGGDCVLCKRICRYLPAMNPAMSETAAWCLGIEPRQGRLAFPRSVRAQDGSLVPPPEDRRHFDFVVDLGKFLATPIMELERDVALRYLRDGDVGSVDKQHYIGWIVSNITSSVERHVKAAGDSRKPNAPDPALLEALREVIDWVVNDAKGGAQLIEGFFAEHRKYEVLNAQAIAKLMFSTSIIYTRPLTNKEMCRSGVVTIAIDC